MIQFRIIIRRILKNTVGSGNFKRFWLDYNYTNYVNDKMFYHL